MWSFPQTPLHALLIICYRAESLRGHRSAALPPPGPAASRGGCFAVVLRFRGAAQTCGGIFTVNVSSRSCCDPCMSLFSPTSHSHTLERSGFPSFDKCAFSLRNSPRFLQAKKKSASHKCQPVLCAEASPAITCQTCHFLNKDVELWNRCKWLRNLNGLILTGFIQLVFVCERLGFFLNLNFINTVCAPKEESLLTFRAPSSNHRCSMA